jgi:putative ABC transport system permease protein
VKQMVAYRWRGLDLTGVSEPERVENYQVSSGFFETLGVKPQMGRVILPEEDRPSGKAAVVLSHRLWERKFDSDPGVIGRSIMLSGAAFTVVGVTPAGFQYPARAESWTPIGRVAPSMMDRGVHQGLAVLGRLKSGVTLGQAQANLDLIARQLAEQFNQTNKDVDAVAESLSETMVRDIRPALLILLGAVGFVLLIACANVANLLLARSATARDCRAMCYWRGARPDRAAIAHREPGVGAGRRSVRNFVGLWGD